MSAPNKIRLDDYLVRRKHAPSRHQANDLIKRRQVLVNGNIAFKPAIMMDLRLKYRIKITGKTYVSRGGVKLEHALEIFGLNLNQQTVLDIGAHHGGFTDCCLQFGAGLVVAIDVGSQTLDTKLLASPKLIAFTKTDVRDFNWPIHKGLPDLIVADLSFISIKNYLDCLKRFCKTSTQVVVLVKPQFEVSPKYLNKGIVSNAIQRRAVFEDLESWFKLQAWQIINKTNSPILGSKGNLERFYLLNPTWFC